MSDMTDRLRLYGDEQNCSAAYEVIHAAADFIDAIDALHLPNTNGFTEWCREDAHDWPCPTHRILYPEAGR